MRSVIFVIGAVIVMTLAFWAYRENYRTQSAINDMNKVQREITSLREELGVLNAEWAYLNRPSRLRQLVDLNFERLRLVPLESDQFAGIANIAYPPAPEKLIRPPRRPEGFDPSAAQQEPQP
ncbi:cell division protein FtsL [Paracoccus jiaweipingae]|uniref:cell division protein FtsL n=1 Tax=unclassified Paracoccus (in: a-proteobacteria) TaxID=2688777 RepID=UPI0037BD18DE